MGRRFARTAVPTARWRFWNRPRKCSVPAARWSIPPAHSTTSENEGVLKRFLALHPEFSLRAVCPARPAGGEGRLPASVSARDARRRALRQPPEQIRRQRPKLNRPFRLRPSRKRRPVRAASAKGKAPAPIALPDVFSDAFTPERLYTAGDALWMLPEQISIERLHGLRVLRTGLLLAHAEGKRSEPDHALAMALRPEEAARTANLTHRAGAGLSGGRNAGSRRPAGWVHPALLRGRFTRLGQTGGWNDEKSLSQRVETEKLSPRARSSIKRAVRQCRTAQSVERAYIFSLTTRSI